jgi:hypothetical protein
VQQNGGSSTEYYYHRAFLRDSGLFLTSTRYDAEFRIEQISREKIGERGAEARAHFLYEPDEANEAQLQSEAQISAAEIFPFSVRDSSEAYRFQLQFHPPSDAALRITLLRTRRFAGDAPDFEFQGKKYACVRFLVEETIREAGPKGVTLEARGEEWYAKGIGLVRYRKSYEEGALELDAALREVFPMSELERRAFLSGE